MYTHNTLAFKISRSINATERLVLKGYHMAHSSDDQCGVMDESSPFHKLPEQAFLVHTIVDKSADMVKKWKRMFGCMYKLFLDLKMKPDEAIAKLTTANTDLNVKIETLKCEFSDAISAYKTGIHSYKAFLHQHKIKMQNVPPPIAMFIDKKNLNIYHDAFHDNIGTLIRMIRQVQNSLQGFRARTLQRRLTSTVPTDERREVVKDASIIVEAVDTDKQQKIEEGRIYDDRRRQLKLEHV